MEFTLGQLINPWRVQVRTTEQTGAADGIVLVAQRGGGCPVPGNVQGQVGWSSEQPGLVETVPTHGRGLELDDLSGPFQP